jgi:hypothetical protein
MPPIMDWDEYASVAHDCGIAPDQIMTVTKHFHRIGALTLHSSCSLAFSLPSLQESSRACVVAYAQV